MKPDLWEISEEDSKFINMTIKLNIQSDKNINSFKRDSREDGAMKFSQETKNSNTNFQFSGYKFPINADASNISENRSENVRQQDDSVSSSENADKEEELQM